MRYYPHRLAFIFLGAGIVFGQFNPECKQTPLTPQAFISVGAAYRSGTMAVDEAGSLYAGTFVNGSRIEKVLRDGTRVVLAGGNESGFAGDGGPATSAKFLGPLGVARDRAGNLYVADSQNNRIRKIDVSGLVTTIAGSGFAGQPPAGASAPLAANIASPWQIKIDSKGNIYFLNSARFGRYLMSILASDGLLRVVLPSWLLAQLGTFEPYAFTLDVNDNIIVAGTSDDGRTFGVLRVRPDGTSEVIEPSTGLIGAVHAIEIDSQGNIYLAEGNRLRMLSREGILTTIAGGAAGSYAPRTDVGFIARLAIHQSTLFLADIYDGSIRTLPLDRCRTGPQPLIAANGPLDSATYSIAKSQSGFYSPGELISIFGKGLGSQNGALGEVRDGVLGISVGETRVLFEGTPAPILYASDSQINAVVPFKVRPGSLQVEVGGVKSDRHYYLVSSTRPGLFVVPGSKPPQPLIAVHADGTINSQQNPASSDSVVLIWGSGFGSYEGEFRDGEIAQAAIPLTQTVTAAIFSQPVRVHYAGSAPGLIAGAIQLNIQLPAMSFSFPYLVSIEFRMGENYVGSGSLWVQ